MQPTRQLRLWLITILSFGALVLMGYLFWPAAVSPYVGGDLMVTNQGAVQTDKSLTIARTQNGTDLVIPLTDPAKPVDQYVTFSLRFQMPAEDHSQISFVTLQGNNVVATTWLDSQTLFVASTQPLLSEAKPTMLVHVPSGFFHPGFRERVQAAVRNVHTAVAGAIGLLVLLLCVLYVVSKTRRQHWHADAEIPLPPAGVTPVQLAILHHSSIRAQDLTALLLDLSRRGSFDVIDRGDMTLFLRHTEGEDLSSYERGFMTLLFSEEKHADLQAVLEKLDKELFSAAVSQIYIDAYNTFQERLYYKENPRIAHLRMKTIGILFQAVGLVGLVFGVFGVAASYSLLYWLAAALYLGGLLTFHFASRTNPLSTVGRAVVGECAAFAVFLTNSQPLVGDDSHGKVFFDYLPYALALGVEVPWLARFRNHAMYLPEWFSGSDETIMSPEHFLAAFRRVSAVVAEHMEAVKDPNAD